MRRFFDYYRQFEELAPEEVSRELRERRDEEKARALTEQPALDLASAAWHEPPHAEIVNAATFALRRAVNAYPDRAAGALAETLAARHGIQPRQVVAGHGAGELLRAACQAIVAGSRADSEGEPELLARLAPTLGVAAPAQAGMASATANEARHLPRRRALAAEQRERIATALAGTELAFTPGTGPLIWLSSGAHTGAELAAHLAARRIFVTPGTAWGDDRHVRIALRGREATDRLAAALGEL